MKLNQIFEAPEILVEQAAEQERIPYLDALRCIQTKQIHAWDSHRGKINSLKPINIDQTNNKLTGFISTGDDKKVRVWSIEGELWGVIDLC